MEEELLAVWMGFVHFVAVSGVSVLAVCWLSKVLGARHGQEDKA